MALGGGVWVTQNKQLPGSYINFVNSATTSGAVGERGIVAIALPLGKDVGKVIEITKNNFALKCKELTGVDYEDAKVIALREIFCNASKVFVYDMGDTGTVADAIKAFEPYEFNVLCAYTDAESDVSAYVAAVESWRDEYGKKCQLVAYNNAADHEGVINVVSTVEDEDAPAYALTAWVAGAEAGCKLNESCTNKLYDGEYTVVVDKSQSELTTCITSGQIVFHLVYGEIRMLEDINSLVTTDEEKGEDFKSNQTIRVVDQIANDIAKLFNTKYLGKIPNNASGRVSLWADIVAHHRQLEEIQAIEAFDSGKLIVEQGNTQKSVVVTDVVTVTNALTQLYMTVVVQ